MVGEARRADAAAPRAYESSLTDHEGKGWGHLWLWPFFLPLFARVRGKGGSRKFARKVAKLIQLGDVATSPSLR